MPEEWKENLPEDLKSSSELKNIDSIENLAKSFVHASKSLSQRHQGVNEDDTWESFSVKAKNFNKIPNEKKDYKLDYNENDKEKIIDIGFKYKIHPMQLKPIVQELKKSFKEEVEKNSLLKNEEWKKQTKNDVFSKVDNKDEIIGRAFKEIGVDRENFESSLGRIHNHPLINKMLLKLGSVSDSSKAPITSGSGNSSDPGFQDMLTWVRRELNNPNSALNDPKQPGHTEAVLKSEEYIKKLSEYQKKSGQTFNL